EQAEERRELDDGIHRHAARVLEWVADGIAHDRGRVKVRALLLQLDLDDLLRVVPGAAGICHKECLEKAEERDRDEVPNKEERIEKRKRQRAEKDDEKDVEHPLLRVRRANLDDLLAVRDRCLLDALELDVRLDELHSAVRARRYGLHARAGEPVDDAS